MGDILNGIQTTISVLLIVIPIAIAIWLVIKLVVPRNPTLGWGLVAGGALLAGFLARRRIKQFSDVESKLAEHDEEMRQFKDVQRGRWEAVNANLGIIRTLTEKREELAKDEAKHRDQIALLDSEIKARKARNEQLINDAESFAARSEERSKSRLALLERMSAEAEPLGDPQEVRPVPEGETRIEVEGFSLVGD